MTNDPHVSTVFLQEANARSENARHIISAFSRATPVLASAWQQLHDALADVPALTAEITRLQADLRGVRLDLANLAAAGRATLAACRKGDPDPLAYLRDELSAQGFWRERP
jgi:ABC-type transporter Mla subunit MlaD